jgi:hypothetical protein
LIIRIRTYLLISRDHGNPMGFVIGQYLERCSML